MFGNKKKSTDTRYVPCQSGRVRCDVDPIKSLLISIKSLVSCPLDIYPELYAATITPFIEYCQALEAIEKQLLLVEATLKLRRGLLLPRNSDSETIAASESRWTYALFSAALFYGRAYDQQEAERIIPAIAIRWLKSDEILFPLWWDSILHKHDEKNELTSIIVAAEKKANLFVIADEIAMPTAKTADPLSEWFQHNPIRVPT